MEQNMSCRMEKAKPMDYGATSHLGIPQYILRSIIADSLRWYAETIGK